jgi:hypothetical protein
MDPPEEVEAPPAKTEFEVMIERAQEGQVPVRVDGVWQEWVSSSKTVESSTV